MLPLWTGNLSRASPRLHPMASGKGTMKTPGCPGVQEAVTKYRYIDRPRSQMIRVRKSLMLNKWRCNATSFNLNWIQLFVVSWQLMSRWCKCFHLFWLDLQMHDITDDVSHCRAVHQQMLQTLFPRIHNLPATRFQSKLLLSPPPAFFFCS